MMNERIGKLAVKAGAHWEHGDWNMPSAVYFSEKDLERFAELIVKECADKVDSSLRDWLHDNSGGTMGDKLKEHFGVEE